MDNAVKNGIGKSRVLNFWMPVMDGKLGDKETGSSAIAVIEEIKEFSGLVGVQLISEPFIENDQIKGGQLLAKLGERTIGFS